MRAAYSRSARYVDDRYGERFYSRSCTDLEDIFDSHASQKPVWILDLGCGTGPYCIELARRGYHTVGIDNCAEMIRIAQGKAEKHGRASRGSVRFELADMRDFRLDHRFDAAICMGGTFGHLVTEDDLERFFSVLRRHLRKEALFVFEFWNIGGVRDGYKTWSKTEVREGTLYMLSESRFDEEKRIYTVTEEYLVLSGDHIVDRFSEVHDLRVYALDDIGRILSDNAMCLLEAFDSRAGRKQVFLSKESFHTIAVARTGTLAP